MVSKAFTGAADVASAEAISMTEGNLCPVDVINVQNTGTAAAQVHVKLSGASDYSVLEGEVPAGTLVIIEGLRNVDSLKIVGTNSAGVITA
tara:strand:- start:843 stop:1115 length:273 start_codon:yes stop_codon:yes gene_type:complete